MYENPNEVLCYDKFSLGREGGKFSKDMKKLKLAAIPMTRGIAEGYNEHTNDSGIMFVLNEAATAKYKEYEADRKANKIANKAKKTIDAKELINNVFDTLLKEKMASGSEKPEPTLKELKAKCEEMGYPKSEWNTLSKADVIEYLKSKSE